MEELYGENLTEYLNGYRAASSGQPFWEHNTPWWLAGYRDYWQDRAERAEKDATWH